MAQKVNAAEQAFTPGKTAPSKSSALTRIVKIRQYSEQNKLFADFLLNYMRHHTWGLTRCEHICETSTSPLCSHHATFFVHFNECRNTCSNTSISRLAIPRRMAIDFQCFTPVFTSLMMWPASSLPIIYSSEESSNT